MGDPVSRATGNVSTLVFQSCLPVAASTAYSNAAASPKNAAYRDPASVGTFPMLIAPRTPRSALKYQRMQPVAASSAYTVPAGLPTNTRPFATDACAFESSEAGNPNAHFTFSRGTSAALIPAFSAL